MYKTLYSVTVHPIQGDPVTFSDNNTTPGAGSAVLAQLTANRDVDSTAKMGNDISHIIIPLHAVDYAEVTEQRTESEYEDDNAKNCVIPETTGSLTITSEKPVSNIAVMFRYDIPGTYGGIEFEAHTVDQGTYIQGTIPQLAAGASIVIDGIPMDTTYQVQATHFSKIGIVPDKIVIEDSQ